MNLRTIGIIIRREYLNRVKKKSFLVTTFLVPVLMAALCIVPILMMTHTKDKMKQVAVVDNSGIVMEALQDRETVKFIDLGDRTVDFLKSNMDELGIDAVLNISPLDSVNRTVTAEITSLKPLGMEMVDNINDRVNSAVEAYRISCYQIEGLEQILSDVKPHIKLKSYTLDEEGKENVSEAGVYMIISIVLGLLLFLFITLFGGMVMSAVIEEKTSRVIEVLVSSVKATELMFGKIIGVALVALTQFFLWIVLTAAIVGAAGPALGQNLLSGGSDPAAIAQSFGVGADQMESVAGAVQDGGQDDLSVVLSTLGNLPVAKLLVVFFIFFIFGYMLYASLFAAVGSAVENEGDSQQLQMPLTIPLMIGYFIAIYTFNAPDSSIAFWGSMFPFTSPIVMLARVPFGVETWEIAVSAALLVATFVLCAYISAKIYKVGILMFGKKSTFKDLWKWLKQK